MSDTDEFAKRVDAAIGELARHEVELSADLLVTVLACKAELEKRHPGLEMGAKAVADLHTILGEAVDAGLADFRPAPKASAGQLRDIERARLMLRKRLLGQAASALIDYTGSELAKAARDRPPA